jgi:hypothetical protein
MASVSQRLVTKPYSHVNAAFMFTLQGVSYSDIRGKFRETHTAYADIPRHVEDFPCEVRDSSWPVDQNWVGSELQTCDV